MNKTILSVLVFCFVVISAGAQVEKTVEQNRAQQKKIDKQRVVKANQTNPQADNPNAPVIEFDKMVHDYGTIAQNSDGSCEFTFTNTGKEPLILSNVRSG